MLPYLYSVLWATACFAVLASAAAVAVAGAATGGGLSSGLLKNRHVGPLAGVDAGAAPNSRRPIRGLQLDHSVGNASHPVWLAGALTPRVVANNLQTFQGAVAGVAAPAVTKSNDATRPFAVGDSTFNDFASAGGRSCDNQHNACADAVNNQKPAGVSVSDCDTQNTQCKDSVASATQTAFTELVSSTDEFDIFCDL